MSASTSKSIAENAGKQTHVYSAISIREQLERAKEGGSFVIYCDRENPNKSARLVKAVEWRMRQQQIDYRLSTQTAVLVHTDHAQAREGKAHAVKPPVGQPRAERVLIVTVHKNPLVEEKPAKQAGDTKSVDQPKRPRGRPRKQPAPPPGE